MKIEMPELAPEDFRFSCPIQVRFRDIDAMGHVNNAVYATYFENARAAYMQALDLDVAADASLQEKFPFVVFDLYTRFLSPVQVDEDLTAYIRTAHLGRSSFVFEYLLTNAEDGRHVTIGRTTQASYDYVKNRTMRIPAKFRYAVERFEGS